MAKELLNLSWIEDLLPDGYLKKKMFGGFSFYIDEKLVLLMFESTGSREYRGQHFDFEIWNGCMFPVEKVHHERILKQFPFLINHPVLPKWLYLPSETEDFDNNVETVLREIRRRNPEFGTIVQSKAPKKKKSKEESLEKIDTRRPSMFGEETAEVKLKEARRISDLKNFGPETEKVFIKAGIKNPQQYIRMGWKKAMAQICEVNPKSNHSLFAYAAIGALKNQMWNLISEDDKKEARDFMKSLRDQAKEKAKTEKSKSSKKITQLKTKKYPQQTKKSQLKEKTPKKKKPQQKKKKIAQKAVKKKKK